MDGDSSDDSSSDGEDLDPIRTGIKLFNQDWKMGVTYLKKSKF